MADALQANNEFSGPIDLSDNDLTNLVSYKFIFFLKSNFCFFLQSCLYLQEAIAREGAKNITKLNLGKNKKFSDKAGIYIGDALIANSSHPVQKLNFKKCNLGENGVIRIAEACNKNTNIKKLNLGFVNDKSLVILAQTLKHNNTLEKLKFQECPVNQW